MAMLTLPHGKKINTYYIFLSKKFRKLFANLYFLFPDCSIICRHDKVTLRNPKEVKKKTGLKE